MLAYHNDENLRHKYIDRAERHRGAVRPGRYTAAAKAGADLTLVPYAFFHWYLTEEGGIRSGAEPETLKAIDDAAEMLSRRVKGDTISMDEWVEKWNALNDRYLASRAAQPMK